MLDRAEFKAQLSSVLRGHVTLSHPIFERLLDARRLDRMLLRRVALQGYQLTKHFIGYIEHLHFHCPLPGFRTALLTNLYEEATGRLSRTDNHLALMQTFLRALGIPDMERDAAVPLPATRELIVYRWNAVRDPQRYHVGAAAVMIASEGQSLETRAGEARHELLGRAYGLAEADLQFFAVHQQEDQGHVEQGVELVSQLCVTERMQQEALAAVDHTCLLFYTMYEDMYRSFCGPLGEAVA